MTFDCRNCHGSGEVWTTGTSVNPRSGIRVRDPQCDDSHVCPRCGGTGEDPDEQMQVAA